MGKESQMVVIRTAYDLGKRDVRALLDCSGEAKLTLDSFKDECDINLIVERFLRGEMLPGQGDFAGSFADVTEFGDYQENLNRVIEADRRFMSLDAKVRERFDNSTAAFLDALVDPTRHDELVELGVLPKPKVAADDAPSTKPPEGASGGEA